MTSGMSPVVPLSVHCLDETFLQQRAAFSRRASCLPARERERALTLLEKQLLRRRYRLADAISADFGGRSTQESLLVEIFGLVDELRYTRRRLCAWMAPQSVRSNWQTWPGRARLHFQPRGVVGVMGAFNYPVYLSLSPAIGALAAGNHVLVKPSELAPATATELQSLIADTFPAEYMSVVTGGQDCSQRFANLPFDYLLFTGSARVGRLVMQAAAANLTPVTLELGGKSPVIVDRDYPLEQAVPDILHAKLLNAGQTCIAPDHVYVPEERLEQFFSLARSTVSRFYPSLVANADYTRIINDHSYRRLEEWLREAGRRGARIEVLNPAGENCNAGNGVFPPALVTGCPEDAALMQQEIFGPVLPVIAYRELHEPIARISRGARPLALYLFSHDRRRVSDVLEKTVSGGVTVNGCLYHVAQHNLPLGGIGESGMGRYHGRAGFETFSNCRAVFHRSRLTPSFVMRPPFRSLSTWLTGTLLHGRPMRETRGLP